MPEMVKIEKKCGLKKDSHVDFSQIFTVDKNRLTNKAGGIPSGKWNEVEKAIGCMFIKTMTDGDYEAETGLEIFINNPSFDFLKDEPDLYNDLAD